MTLVLTSPLGTAQDGPKAQVPPPAAKSKTTTEITQAVDQLVEELRRAPAKPTLAEGRVGLYLIDSSGGDATLIASEPERWLVQCGSASWSRDGRQIAFDVTPGNSDFSQSRIKVLNLNESRVELKDLGPGNCPSFSPTGEQIVFLLNPGGVPGATSGVWLMRSDGTERTFLGGYGRPRWSEESGRFMIVPFGSPTELTIIDAREGQGGAVALADKQFFQVPSWAGPETIVAGIGDATPAEIALIDVSRPAQATVKEVIYKEAGANVNLYSPVYSAATGRCVFIGKTEGQGHALYSIDKGQKNAPKRLESRGFDNVIQDPAFSPDGRYIVFASNREPDLKAKGLRHASVEAPAVDGITIDGDLKDWPPAMERHAIANLHTFPPANGKGSLENAFMTTSKDFSAAMSIGWDPKYQLIYLAVVVRDDELVVGNTSPWDSDAIEVYIDGLRNEKSLGFPTTPDHAETFSASDAPLLQYIGLPGKGPVYGTRKTVEGENNPDDNTVLSWGDIKKTKTKMAFKRTGDVTTYEWAIQAFDRYPDKPTKLLPGLHLGFDVVISDKDVPAKSPRAANDPEPDRAAWISWSDSKSKAFRPLDASCLGEIILGRVPAP
jgi:hypothetical protein